MKFTNLRTDLQGKQMHSESQGQGDGDRAPLRQGQRVGDKKKVEMNESLVSFFLLN